MSAQKLLFIHALTPLHSGSGTALGIVDLPVARERHTGWPLIPGSSLKGILRDAYREHRKGSFQDDPAEWKADKAKQAKWLSARAKANRDDDELTAIFGPDTDGASDHAGALAVSDARLFAFPVRSLCGTFAWVTCVEALRRARQDGVGQNEKLPLPSTPKSGELFSAESPSPLCIDEKNKVILEDSDFSLTKNAELAKWASTLAGHFTGDEATRKAFNQRLVLLPDDDFSHFVRTATQIDARIGLNYDTKTTKQGALFYEEYIPAEAIFYAPLIADDSHHQTHVLKADQVLDAMCGLLKTRTSLQIGAGASIGKGFCATRIV